ncbi:MAG: hypothetical protein ABIO93_07105 [Dyadobacter sp.]|uniref:hypothetical protein n=1 Tax=Dyadobacter sp. TaxID=1914288 RepID=UPI003264429F
MMEEKNHSHSVPENRHGDSIDTETSRVFRDTAEARALFNRAKLRLFDVNRWHECSGEQLAHFMLADTTGNQVPGPAQEGHYIKIDIPGPGTQKGDGFDWVIIEEVKEERTGTTESLALRVRPADDPTSEGHDTTHFYSKESTSTFIVAIDQLTVSAGVYDRNLEANPESDNLFDKVRNAIIGFIGKKALSVIQWKVFTEGLLAD